jgi:hypothetical protein
LSEFERLLKKIGWQKPVGKYLALDWSLSGAVRGVSSSFTCTDSDSECIHSMRQTAKERLELVQSLKQSNVSVTKINKAQLS